MRRLGNVQISKEEGTTPLLKLMGTRLPKKKENAIPTYSLKLNVLGATKLEVAKGDRVDVYEDMPGEFYIAKTVNEDEGRVLSEMMQFSGSAMYKVLKPHGIDFEITDEKLEETPKNKEILGGLTWYRLKAVALGKTTTTSTENATSKAVVTEDKNF